MEVKLTPREVEILTLVAQGMTSRQITTVLYVSETYIKHTLTEVRGKMGAFNTAHAVAIAIRWKLITE